MEGRLRWRGPQAWHLGGGGGLVSKPVLGPAHRSGNPQAQSCKAWMSKGGGSDAHASIVKRLQEAGALDCRSTVLYYGPLEV